MNKKNHTTMDIKDVLALKISKLDTEIKSLNNEKDHYQDLLDNGDHEQKEIAKEMIAEINEDIKECTTSKKEFEEKLEEVKAKQSKIEEESVAPIDNTFESLDYTSNEPIE